jgi:hypothetical protein
MKKLLLIVCVFLLSGCATTGGQTEFYKAQQDFMVAQANIPQKPLFEMKAIEGKAVENLASIVVYAPGDTKRQALIQYQEKEHPAWQVASTAIKTAGTVLGVYFIAEGVKNIVGAITSSGASTTMNVSGTGNTSRIVGTTSNTVTGAGNYTGGTVDTTHTPTVVPTDVVIVPAQVVNPVIVNPVIVP